jgi:hypothetical protein
VNRRQSIAGNLRQLGLRGLAGAVRQTIRGTRGTPSLVSRRAAYDISRGTPPPDLDGRPEMIPAGAGAALSGLHDFLLGLPGLSGRRAALQAARQRSDREILSRFARHWTSSVPSPHQGLYDELHRTLVDVLDIADLARPPATASPDLRSLPREPR